MLTAVIRLIKEGTAMLELINMRHQHGEYRADITFTTERGTIRYINLYKADDSATISISGVTELPLKNMFKFFELVEDFTVWARGE